MSPEVHIDASDYVQLADFWSREPAITREELLRAVTEADLLMQSQLMEDLPKGAGAIGGGGGLAGGIKTDEQVLADGVVGLVYPSSPYALWVEEGTKPHAVSEAGIQAIADWAEIKLGKNEQDAQGMARAVAWKIRAKGTKPNPVWRTTLEAKRAEIREIVDAALVRIAERLAGASA